MPEITTLTLTDGESTPVDHVFTVSDKSATGVLEFRSADFDGHAHQDMVLTLSSKKMSDGGRRIKGKLTIRGEHVDTNTGAFDPMDLFSQVGEFSFRTSGYSGDQERKNLATMIGDAVNEALILSTVEKNDGVW